MKYCFTTRCPKKPHFTLFQSIATQVVWNSQKKTREKTRVPLYFLKRKSISLRLQIEGDHENVINHFVP
jgi:hypothetical protein